MPLVDAVVWDDHLFFDDCTCGVLHHMPFQLLVKEHDDDYHHHILVLSTCFQIKDDVYMYITSLGLVAIVV